MAQLTVSLEIKSSRHNVTNDNLIEIFNWLKAKKVALDALPSVTSTISCTIYTDSGDITSTISIFATKDADFTAQDLSALRTWIKDNILDKLPNGTTVKLAPFVWFP